MTATTATDVFRMPSLGADMTEGRVVEWLVEPGAPVRRGELVAVVETDKSDIEVEVFEPCVFEEFLVEPGAVVAVGTPIARIRPERRSVKAPEPEAPDSQTPDAQPHATQTPESQTPDAQPHVTETPDAQTPDARPHAAQPPDARPHVTHTRDARAPEGRARNALALEPRRPVASPAARSPVTPKWRATPRARRLAAERDLALDSLSPVGVITGDTVLATTDTGPTTGAERPAPRRPAADSADPMRRAIARGMSRSWTEIPHYHVASRVDVTDLSERITRRNGDCPPSERLLIGVVLDLACARAIADVPELNGWWRDGAFVAADSVDLGLVLSLRRGGLLVATIPAADRLDSTEMMERVRDLTARARRGRLRSSETGEPSITVTSLGDRGADSVFGVIHPPQVALVGLGRVLDEAMVLDRQVLPRRVVHVSVAGDHRAHDAASASRFLQRFDHHLEALP